MVNIYEAFQKCKTVEELRETGKSFASQIQNLSSEDKEWLRDAYESKKWCIENPGISDEEYEKQLRSK